MRMVDDDTVVVSRQYYFTWEVGVVVSYDEWNRRFYTYWERRRVALLAMYAQRVTSGGR